MRGHTITVDGEAAQVAGAVAVLEDLRAMLRENGRLRDNDVRAAVSRVRGGGEEGRPRIEVFAPAHYVQARSDGQARYIAAMQRRDVIFATGPAGTGKTYLAVAMAVSALKEQQVRKIVLTRPARETGEKLGFLPGDLQTKINPYLRPLYDALGDMMDPKLIRRYAEEDVLEVAPLAYMRGRTLDRAFIILDEGQNCTTGQMKMFLTRLGRGSKTVVTGDLSQVDLPAHMPSGMVEAMEILRGVKGIAFVRLRQRDIVRHRLVQNIVDAYEAHEQRGREASSGDAAEGTADGEGL